MRVSVCSDVRACGCWFVNVVSDWLKVRSMCVVWVVSLVWQRVCLVGRLVGCYVAYAFVCARVFVSVCLFGWLDVCSSACVCLCAR